MRYLPFVAALAACSQSPLADHVRAIAATQDRLFWTESDGSMYSATPFGDDKRVVAPRPSTASGSSMPIVVTSTAIFWTVDNVGTDATLWRAELDGTGATPLVVLHEPVSEVYAVDDTDVFYARVGGLVAQPLDGSAERTLSSGRGYVSSPALGDDHVVFVDGGSLSSTTTNGIWSSTRDGSSVQHIVSDSEHAIWTIAADDTSVYWSRMSANSSVEDGGTFRAALDGTGRAQIGPETHQLLRAGDRLLDLTCDLSNTCQISSRALDGSDVRVHVVAQNTLLVGPAVAAGRLFAFEADPGAETYHLVTVALDP
jgi:hypothetical protein